MGQFKGIGNFSDWQQQANSRSSTAFLIGIIGFFCDYQQSSSWVNMGQFDVISSILISSNGPTRLYQHCF
jgi:hypothetical protein